MDPLHQVEVLVLAEDGKRMLAAQRRDPGVIGWNRGTRNLQLTLEFGVSHRSFGADIEHPAGRQELGEPSLVVRFAARLHEAEAVLSHDDSWNGEHPGTGDPRHHGLTAIGDSGQRVGVEDY
jgi:hypothetical protein